MTTRITVTMAIPDVEFANRFQASEEAVADALADHLHHADLGDVEPDVWTVDVSSDIPGWSSSR
ncbi:hypothetical protein CLV30_12886 [Haloactinopolyspora alba]|uniref:Uncharacterized protein n=1 Tax=Haloactinopolyspora alba TaxID=648780 RepID=A0A2P8DF37_9ACTN|nr:hypothetical protein [Haloactinopolyspora alba]PSK95834.1 hypothetical protein CLV30_12886 [Haloactinopolyspora alba]